MENCLFSYIFPTYLFSPQNEQLQQTDDFFNSLLTSEKLHNMLLSLRQYDSDNDEFQREVRKPSPLRLRFGRSAAGDTTEQKVCTH